MRAALRKGRDLEQKTPANKLLTPRTSPERRAFVITHMQGHINVDFCKKSLPAGIHLLLASSRLAIGGSLQHE